MLAHNGHSSVCCVGSVLLSTPVTSNCIAPAPVHTSCMLCGCTAGDAIAIPSDNTNQTSARRAIRWALRSFCIAEFLHSQSAFVCGAWGQIFRDAMLPYLVALH